MIEETLFFQSPRFLTELYCGAEDNLVQAEQSLNTKIVCRDDWLKISGEQDLVNQAAKFFKLLEKAKKQGMRITRSDFRNMLELAKTVQSKR